MAEKSVNEVGSKMGMAWRDQNHGFAVQRRPYQVQGQNARRPDHHRTVEFSMRHLAREVVRLAGQQPHFETGILLFDGP